MPRVKEVPYLYVIFDKTKTVPLTTRSKREVCNFFDEKYTRKVDTWFKKSGSIYEAMFKGTRIMRFIIPKQALMGIGRGSNFYIVN